MAGLLPGGRRPPLLLIAGAAVLMLGGIAVASATQLSRLKRDLVQKQQAIASLRAENTALQDQLDTVQKDQKVLVDRVNELRGQLTAANGELARMRSSTTELQTRYDDVSDARARLDTQVKRLTRERDEATEQMQRLDADKKELERVSARLRERFTLLDRDYQKLSEKVAELEQQQVVRGAPASPQSLPTYLPAPASEEGASAVSTQPMTQEPSQPSSFLPPAAGSSSTVELPPIIVRKEQAGTGLPIRARLVEASTQHRFVVLDKGATGGVRVGMTFDIVRGGAIVARASAVRVRPQLTACDVSTSRSADFPQVGDLAVQRNP